MEEKQWEKKSNRGSDEELENQRKGTEMRKRGKRSDCCKDRTSREMKKRREIS